MREDITSIPVSEVFEPRDGCPLCRLRDRLEERVVTYITGAAMMEPDVRQETNRTGFCLAHYKQMLGRRNRLSVALMLQSYLDELDKTVFAGPPLLGRSAGRQRQKADKATASCFVCRKTGVAFDRMLLTVCRLWEQERDFRALFDEQTSLCLPHFARLTETAATAMSRKNTPEFQKACARLSRRSLQELKADVDHFCRMFDYRNAGGDWGNARDAVERTVEFLTGHHPDTDRKTE